MFLQQSQALATVARPGVAQARFWRINALGATLCALTFSFGSSVLIARALAPGAFGVYTFVLWLATVGVPAIGIGMSALTSRHLADIQSRQEPRVAAGIFSFVWRRQYRHILAYCLVYVVLAVPLSWFYRPFAPLLLLLLAGLSALLLLLSGVVSIALRSLHRFDVLAMIQLFDTATMLLLIIIATQAQPEPVEAFLLILASASALTLTMALFCIIRLLPLRRAIQPGPLLKERLTRGVSNSLPLFVLDAIVWQRSEVLFLAHWSHAADLGFYALGSMISARIMTIPPLLLSTCVLPLLLRYSPRHRYKSATDAYIKTSCYVAILAIPLCVLAFMLCPLLVTFLLGDAYLPIVLPLRILLVPAAIGSIATVSLTHLAQSDRRKAQIWLGTIAAMLNLGLALPCILMWGITGAAIASAVAQIVSATGSILLCKKSMFG